MIVCVCNAIREDELRSVARDGASNTRAAYKALGCEPQCGCCLTCAQEVIDDERGRPARRNRSSITFNFPRAA